MTYLFKYQSQVIDFIDIFYLSVVGVPDTDKIAFYTPTASTATDKPGFPTPTNTGSPTSHHPTPTAVGVVFMLR